MAQVPPPPPSNAGAANSGPVSNGAPIGSGLGIMLALIAAYGGKKHGKPVKSLTPKTLNREPIKAVKQFS